MPTGGGVVRRVGAVAVRIAGSLMHWEKTAAGIVRGIQRGLPIEACTAREFEVERRFNLESCLPFSVRLGTRESANISR
jgi:hypothetical protein